MTKKIPKTFQDRVADAIDSLMADIYPSREPAHKGKDAPYIVLWHHFPTEEQIGDRLEKGKSQSEAFSKSSCGKSSFSGAEFSKKSKRDANQILCQICVRKSGISEDEFQAKAKAVMAEAFRLQDSLL